MRIMSHQSPCVAPVIIDRKGEEVKMGQLKRMFWKKAQEERIQDLAATMLPTLLVRRFDLGMGGEPDEEFVRMAMDLAEKIMTRKTGKGPRTLIQEAMQESAHKKIGKR
jgi:hypothetical protein